MSLVPTDGSKPYGIVDIALTEQQYEQYTGQPVLAVPFFIVKR